MNIDHVHFYVEDAPFWRDWFIQVLGFQSASSQFSSQTDRHTQTEVVSSGAVSFWLSSALTAQSPVATYLQCHPPGIVDVAFQVKDMATAIARALDANATIIQSFDLAKACQIVGWGKLRHTLVEVSSPIPVIEMPVIRGETAITGIDHVVLNVAKGELEPAIAFYERVFGFQRQQSFAIRTDRSALCSQVLTHPDGAIKLPINEPATEGSQIQEFLDLNGGAGIQHLALRTEGIVEAIAHFRKQGLAFLRVPLSYYEQLRQRQGFQLTEAEWKAIASQEVLVDWQADQSPALLLQAFTQPIFSQPTFFFELIERRRYWAGATEKVAQGFGEANFQALFEAIEREQIKRGSLN
ncbi:MAG: 4-hydroxyphenylpyruvate dioxygenase [Timaviella obliquedivisa GSE-PSE-MK23-08B]|jgi:4-hydroxyphenylpyruvate dioxygenase|nr:4-hydroxyphenylpyruvate dioxygenase [Timaviella obliquedivisa GSE-PSE-MK23-08B]